MYESVWGPLASRYEHPQPQRKILALDGGGIRGIITLGILAELERQLKTRLHKGEEFRLADYFDHIGGTSTGAIIAAGLSTGMSVKALTDFYLEHGEAMFDKAFLMAGARYFYNDGALLEKLKETFGHSTSIDLASGAFRTLLTVVTMNRTTDSPWPISNNPLAKYNDQERTDCNLRIKLYQLVRASTAAPIYFRPETLQWDPNDPEKTFVFVDGGMTPYNNPAFLMYRMATQPAYKLNWATGENKLLIVSIGTGSAPSGGTYNFIPGTLKELPTNLMYAMQVDQDINCRTVGRCSYGTPIDREMDDLIVQEANQSVKPSDHDLGKQFLYVRYNANLSPKGLTDMGLSELNSEKVREMDQVSNIPALTEIGKRAASQVSVDHFHTFCTL